MSVLHFWRYGSVLFKKRVLTAVVICKHVVEYTYTLYYWKV